MGTRWYEKKQKQMNGMKGRDEDQRVGRSRVEGRRSWECLMLLGLSLWVLAVFVGACKGLLHWKALAKHERMEEIVVMGKCIAGQVEFQGSEWGDSS